MKAVLPCLLALLALVSSAEEVMRTPNGQLIVDVTQWGPKGIPRVRLYPANADRSQMYEVTDAVVAQETGKKLTVNCQSSTNCEVVADAGKLVINAADADVNVEFHANNQKLIVADLTATEYAQGTFRFPGAKKFYGIPEHAVDLTLKEGVEYRLMNLDVFHYKLDDGGGIYGSIPFLMAHSADSSSGILWLNSADTAVNLLSAESSPLGAIGTSWKSQAGIVDVFFMPGPRPADVQEQHSSLTGPVYLPPQFALGYHQCRWNYRSTADSLDVDNGFDTHNIPYDVLWLDIEHTDGKKYFTWDLNNFPEPRKLVDAISAKGRKLVTITDPHIKRQGGYHVHDQAEAQGFYVKNEQGGDFEGHCWPGTSSWIDFYNKKARDWYATLFKYENYPGSSPDLYSWIDMNEPSVFNAHEVTMDRNLIHTSAEGKKVKHVELHNMYGFYHTMAAFQGHILRNEPKPTRPFILTRSFFAGSQRYTAMWTGDNKAEWGHLVKSIPMVLTLAISNFPFAGADVGGFFFNPPEKLMVRWYQAGVFYPFFRGHAHLETKRREPWLFGEENTRLIRNAIALRYALIPYLYTTFYKAHRDGGNVIRPLFYEFPTQEAHFDEQQAFMFGPSLLVRPLTEEEEISFVRIRLPADEKWYSFPSGEANEGGREANVAVTMDTIPMYLRGGHVLPTRQRLRRSTAAMQNDPVTLHVALNAQGKSSGDLYMDDGIGYDYQKGGYILQRFTFDDNQLKGAPSPRIAGDAQTYHNDVELERIVFYGLPKAPVKAQVAVGSTGTTIDVQALGNTYVIRRPNVKVDSEWSIRFEF